MSTKSYAGSHAWSDACLPNGNGQCDGIVPDDEKHAGEECGHSCHNAWEDEFSEAQTVTDMERAHRVFWKDDNRTVTFTCQCGEQTFPLVFNPEDDESVWCECGLRIQEQREIAQRNA